MITGLFKLAFNLIRLAILLIVILLIFHTWTIKQALTLSLTWSLGADVSLETVKMDWKNTGFEVHELKIGNPYGLPEGLLADIPLAIVSVDVPQLLHGSLRLKTVGIHLREFRVAHYLNKGVNVMELKPLKGKGQNQSPPGEAAKGRRDESTVKIDELIVSVKSLTLIESVGGIQKEKTIPVGVQGATYYDLKSTNDIVYAIVAPALKKLGFRLMSGQLTQFWIDYAQLGAAQSSGADGFLERLKKVFS